MRLLLVILLSTSVFLTSADDPADWKKLNSVLQEECRNETKVDSESLLNLRKTGVVDRSNRKLMHHVFCVAEHSAFIDEKANLNIDVIHNHLAKLKVPEDLIARVNHICANIEKSDDILVMACDYYECFYTHLPKDVMS